MTHRLLILIGLLSIAIAGCSASNVKNLRFTKDNKDQVLEAVRKSRDLTGEEVGLLMAAVARDAISGGVLEGKTVGEVIGQQRKFNAEVEAKEREEKRLAEEARRKEEALAKQLLGHLTVSVYEKGFQAANIYAGSYEDYFTIKVAMHNKGKKTIRAFRGSIIFRDLFGTVIYTATFSHDGGLREGQTKRGTYTLKYNQFIAEDRLLRNTALSNMKVEWKPKTILFADGTKIGE